MNVVITGMPFHWSDICSDTQEKHKALCLCKFDGCKGILFTFGF
jgi:hypothetical protein